VEFFASQKKMKQTNFHQHKYPQNAPRFCLPNFFTLATAMANAAAAADDN